MKTAKIFKNGESQAVRLPKEFRMSGTEVFVKKQGNVIILLPKDQLWASFLEGLNGFTDDIFSDRDQPKKQQKRKAL